MRYKHGMEVPRIEDENIFERICLDIVKVQDEFELAQLNGRRGQRQNGVDIFYRKKSNPNEWIGIQCKVKSNEKIEASEIREEIEKVKTFNPTLTEYHIFTTAKRDVKIQEFIRMYQTELPFSVQIMFWEDITLLLQQEQFKEVHYKYYSDFYIRLEDYEKQIQDGYCYGKLITVDIAPTCYSLMIGKIIRKDPSSTENNTTKRNLSYWTGTNFIAYMLGRTFEIFPKPCHPSDIELVFENKHDRWFICEWLNSIDVDEILKSDEVAFYHTITKESLAEFHRIYCSTDYDDDDMD